MPTEDSLAAAPDPVPVEKIATAPVEVPGSSDLDRARQEAAQFAHQQEYFRKELGWLGKPFGGRSEKPGNISALVIVLCFAAMFVIYFWPPNPTSVGSVMTVDRMFAGLTSIVTLVLGYLFGSNERTGRDQ